MYDSVFRRLIPVAFSQEELLSATLDAFFVGCSAWRLTIFFPQLRAVKAGDKKKSPGERPSARKRRVREWKRNEPATHIQPVNGVCGNGSAARVTGARNKQAKERTEVTISAATGSNRRKRGSHRGNPRGIYARTASLALANEPDQAGRERKRDRERGTRDRKAERRPPARRGRNW